MSGKFNYLEYKILDHVLATTAYAAPSAVYLSLHYTSPGENDSGTEVSTGGYAREEVSFNSASGGSATGPTTDKEFTASGAAWNGVAHFGIYDASSAGNLLYYGALSASKDIADGDSIRFVADSITITEG
jgi:hypothetical protein